MYLHSPDARTFFCRTVYLRTSAHPRACHIHARLKGAKKVLCTCVVSLHLRFLPSYVSPIFCCFRTTTLSLDFPIHTFLPCSPVLKALGTRISARGREVWLTSPPSTQVMSPTSSTRSLLWTVTRCSLTIQTSMKSLTLEKHTRQHWIVRCSALDTLRECPRQDENEGKNRGGYPGMVGSKDPITTADCRPGHTCLP